MTTDTTPMAPTDAEIDAVLCNHWPAFSMQATLVRMWLRDAMRASLDKWGQPAHSGKSFQTYGETRAYSKGYYAGKKAALVSQPAGYALVPVEPSAEMVDAAQEAYMPFGDMQLAIQLAIAAAPQPVEREPLSDEQIHAIYDEVARREPYAGAVTRRSIVRAIEAAHGIKGGQHGTE